MATSYNDSSPTGAMEAIDLDTSASGSGFFSGDPKKHDDLKTMLDSSKESHKLEAMKRIIGLFFQIQFLTHRIALFFVIVKKATLNCQKIVISITKNLYIHRPF